jgi:PPOX class probable F420-dependent enzyme
MATVTEDGRPHLVPVTFAADGNYIYTAVDAKPKSKTAAGGLQRLRNIRADPRVAVLADHYEDDWTLLWWVRADGRAAVLEDPRQMGAPIALLAARYPQYRDLPPAGPVIVIRAERWTGWAASPPR